MDDWHKDAACRGLGTKLFYTDTADAVGRHREDVGTVALAKAVCGTCPVREPCLEWARSFPELFGVWGGTSEREREKLRKARRGSAA